MKYRRWFVRMGTWIGTACVLWVGRIVPAQAQYIAIDLTAPGFTSATGIGISGTQQVGRGFGPGTGFNEHALLWSGTAASFVDLNPTGFTFSEALGISGTQQVGFGSSLVATGGNTHALLWSGTAASFVDLQTFLPAGFVSSEAAGIDPNGDIVGDATDASGNAHAILWERVGVVPEPGSLGLLLTGLLVPAAALLSRRRKSTQG